ncbi:hypothetical protein AX774_g2910 [Zancudomyces culisetae]|uniref:Uncharacterized protein n=1 Tax=Zancudomyces culisetae TaxID=1213189 RepID=A0A1R1PRR7_ZANCU|nr:hypothetical protein AX774_g2910 [Zancudomyces culisetae]|eukprot:OMH83582.1 hypothetical protein AX774_g2910 [Zancudomyces culisetae]
MALLSYSLPPIALSLVESPLAKMAMLSLPKALESPQIPHLGSSPKTHLSFVIIFSVFALISFLVIHFASCPLSSPNNSAILLNASSCSFIRAPPLPTSVIFTSPIYNNPATQSPPFLPVSTLPTTGKICDSFSPLSADIPTWIAPTNTYFPNLDELSFLVVLAFPNDSNIGFVANIICSVLLISLPDPLTSPPSSCAVAKYLIIYFALTVFPAPDSPDTIIVWFFSSLTIPWYAFSAIANKCGSNSPFVRPAYARSISFEYS